MDYHCLGMAMAVIGFAGARIICSLENYRSITIVAEGEVLLLLPFLFSWFTLLLSILLLTIISDKSIYAKRHTILSHFYL